MKRLSLLVLSILMLTLLSMPASADSKKVTTLPDESTEIPVYLTVDTSTMVNVTIEWDELAYSYDYNGKTFSPGVENMPSITVTNNNPQMTVTALPTFEPNTELGFGENDFALNFFATASETLKSGSAITKAVSVTYGTPAVFYAVPSGTPTNNSILAGTADGQNVGNVRITIEKPSNS